MKPRVHGNGIIQLPLTKKLRLHVWPDETFPIKRQEVSTAIHTHRFSYKSTLITGHLIHRQYAFVKYDEERTSEATHRLYEPAADERLYRTSYVGILRIINEVVLWPGDEYTFGANRFHEMILGAPLSVTLIEKTEEHTDPVYVACKIDEEPDNVFDRDADNPEEMLWSIIVKALRSEK